MRQLEIPRYKREDDIKIGPRAVGWSGMDGIDLTKERSQRNPPENTVMNF
jgi:hypothetical protein